MKTLVEKLADTLQKMEPENESSFARTGTCRINTKNLKLPFVTAEIEFSEKTDAHSVRKEKVGIFTWRMTIRIDVNAMYGILLGPDDTPVILEKENRKYQIGVLLESKKPNCWENTCNFDAMLVEQSERPNKTLERINERLDWNRRVRQNSRSRKKKVKK